MLTHEQYDGPPWPDDLGDEPVELFEGWFQDAIDAGCPEVAACCLATCDAAGAPSARMVLFRGLDESGLRFYTNYQSRKARELEENPRAAMVFWWEPLKRQVRIEGGVERLPGAVSDEYFAGRPRPSQLGAWASQQSAFIESRKHLETRLHEVEEKFGDGPVERPHFWGGYRLCPRAFEFWQGRPNRLHDRQRFELTGEGWQSRRLMP